MLLLLFPFLLYIMPGLFFLARIRLLDAPASGSSYLWTLLLLAAADRAFPHAGAEGPASIHSLLVSLWSIFMHDYQCPGRLLGVGQGH